MLLLLSLIKKEKKSNEQIKYLYKKTKGKFIIIGVGGIFSAEDAYKKIRLGASSGTLRPLPLLVEG